MASEIRVLAALEALKGNFQLARTQKQLTIDMDGQGGVTPGQVIIGLVAQAIDLSGLDRPGWCMIQNIDEEAYVDWGGGPSLGSETGTGTGADNDGLVGRLEAGEVALFRLHPAAEIMMRASAENTRVLILALED